MTVRRKGQGGDGQVPERPKTKLRCAIYTRVSSDAGLEQDFNSLDNQREAAEAYVKSQAHEGWTLLRDRYDDGGYLRRLDGAARAAKAARRRRGSAGST